MEKAAILLSQGVPGAERSPDAGSLMLSRLNDTLRSALGSTCYSFLTDGSLGVNWHRQSLVRGVFVRSNDRRRVDLHDVQKCAVLLLVIVF